MTKHIQTLLSKAAASQKNLLIEPHENRNRAILAIAESIEKQQSQILTANEEDLSQAHNLSSALRDRLKLTPSRMQSMIQALIDVSKMPDPLAKSTKIGDAPSGIEVWRQRIPLGIIAVVYEARPNVTADCTGLAIKSGNGIVLRGGKEAANSNRAIADAIADGLRNFSFADSVQVLSHSSREDIKELLGATGLVDLVIPRGGKNLMRVVDEFARVPVIRHGDGVCQVYIHDDADPEMAIAITNNSKLRRPAVCNAVETVLVSPQRFEDTLIPLAQQLVSHNVEIRADERSLAVLIQAGINAKPASPEDWDTEFANLILAVRTIDSIEDAVTHISKHGTYHTAAIVSQNETIAEQFLKQVDASCVLWNASTGFNDGGSLGLGAEIGISTTKMHAYGPMSINELTSEKYVVRGQGQIRPA